MVLPEIMQFLMPGLSWKHMQPRPPQLLGLLGREEPAAGKFLP
jgi:hypothetical protein